MSTLHIIRQSAFNTCDLAQCLDLISDKDALVLMDDGCYNLNHALLQPLIQPNQDININVVESHAAARAIQISQDISPITMTDVVNLTFAHNKVITWQ